MNNQTEIIKQAGWATDIKPCNDLQMFGNAQQIFKATCMSGAFACTIEIVIDKHNIQGYDKHHLNVRFHSRNWNGFRVPRQDFDVPSQIQNLLIKHDKHPSPEYFSELMDALFSTSEKKAAVVNKENGFEVIFLDRVN